MHIISTIISIINHYFKPLFSTLILRDVLLSLAVLSRGIAGSQHSTTAQAAFCLSEQEQSAPVTWIISWDTTYTHHLHQVNRLNLHIKNTTPYSCGKCNKQGKQLHSPGAAWREKGPHCTLADRVPPFPQLSWPCPSLPRQLSKSIHWNTKLKLLTLETFHCLSWQHHLLCNGFKVYENRTQWNDLV